MTSFSLHIRLGEVFGEQQPTQERRNPIKVTINTSYTCMRLMTLSSNLEGRPTLWMGLYATPRAKQRNIDLRFLRQKYAKLQSRKGKIQNSFFKSNQLIA
ncbi:hypothetical protein FGO68_gene9186 [Halteria grandinella]|uniref:Uncharacterized protein n=1 Tax=Halteria grandinella TaxID=5974 RepID=A0A8J8SZD2_HALGN|nr:hypothetical protein FGO68_gene9186 [Halteria grandinella]